MKCTDVRHRRHRVGHRVGIVDRLQQVELVLSILTQPSALMCIILTVRSSDFPRPKTFYLIFYEIVALWFPVQFRRSPCVDITMLPWVVAVSVHR